jgi:ribosomal protein L18E
MSRTSTWRADGVQLSESDQQKLQTAIELNQQIRTLLKKKDRLSRDLAAAYREETRTRSNLDVSKIDKTFGQKALEKFQAAQLALETISSAVKQNAKSIENLETQKRKLAE